MTLITFILFTALVAALTWWLTRGSDTETEEGFFLAGRSLTAVFIAGSLLLTNLSTEQLIGLNAGAFNEGLSVMCWEVGAGVSLVFLALFFLPRYLRSGIATVPQFLEERYGATVRALVSTIFIVAYMVVLLPFVLYLGANGLNGMLGIDTMFEITRIQAIWWILILIAVLGSAYAIGGGLKAIAVSDTLNGIGLLIGGLLVTWFSMQLIGNSEGGWSAAFQRIREADPDALQSLGSAEEDAHWPTLFTGVFLINFFYWTTNQQIIQRTFGAKNLAEGQKGVLLAAFFKMLAPLILILPGIIAAFLVFEARDPEIMHAVGQDDQGQWIANNAYAALVAGALPEWMLGFFAAVIVGSILSTFNSVLNSAATLFSLDIFAKHIRPNAGMRTVVLSGRICSFVVAVLATVLAPMIFYGRQSVFNIFQSLNAVYFIPLLAVVLFGMFQRTANGRSALITIVTGLGLMIVGTFFSGGSGGWLQSIFGSGYHFAAAVFVLLLVLQFSLAAGGMKREQPYVQQDAGAVDLTPWPAAPVAGSALVLFALAVYVYFAM